MFKRYISRIPYILNIALSQNPAKGAYSWSVNSLRSFASVAHGLKNSLLVLLVCDKKAGNGNP
jgi:hypothetical protein